MILKVPSNPNHPMTFTTNSEQILTVLNLSNFFLGIHNSKTYKQKTAKQNKKKTENGLRKKSTSYFISFSYEDLGFLPVCFLSNCRFSFQEENSHKFNTGRNSITDYVLWACTASLKPLKGTTAQQEVLLAVVTLHFSLTFGEPTICHYRELLQLATFLGSSV